MNNGQTDPKCLICGSIVSKTSHQHISVEISDGTPFFAHSNCIEALQSLIKQKGFLPEELGESCLDLIYTLYLEQWFSEARTLNDVTGKIKQMGYNYNLSTISNALRSFTRRGILTRQGKTKSYSYIQKRPPS